MSFINALAGFGLITLAIVGLSIMHTYATRGFGFGFSSNRPQSGQTAFEIRLGRTLQNHTESAAYVVPALLAAQFSGVEGAMPSLAAMIIVIGRALFAPLYLSGVPFIRVPAFAMGSLPSLYLLIQSLS